MYYFYMSYTIMESLENNNSEEHWFQKDISTQIITELGNDEIEKLFAPLKNIDYSKEEIFDFLKKVIEHIHTLIKKEKVENEYIDTCFGKLSARKILSNGKIFYMNPCVDFVLVTIEGLKKSACKNIKLIVDELQCPWNIYKIHLGIEVNHEWKTYYIDYKSKNDVCIWAWKFKSKYEDKEETTVNTIEIEGKNVSTDDTLYDLIEKWVLPFKFFDPRILDMLKAKLKQDNTEEERKSFLTKIGNPNKANIYIEKN